MEIPNLEQYVTIFPKGSGTGPDPKRVRKIPDQAGNSQHSYMLTDLFVFSVWLESAWQFVAISGETIYLSTDSAIQLPICSTYMYMYLQLF